MSFHLSFILYIQLLSGFVVTLTPLCLVISSYFLSVCPEVLSSYWPLWFYFTNQGKTFLHSVQIFHNRNTQGTLQILLTNV